MEEIPSVTYFKPRGIPLRYLEEVSLAIEELEAIRLKDLEGLDQEEAAQRMGVSRPTFQRVLESARSKIAQALVNGGAIRVEGGNFEMAVRRFKCAQCGHEWEVPFGRGRGIDMVCPQCASPDIYRLIPGRAEVGPPGRCRRGSPLQRGRGSPR